MEYFQSIFGKKKDTLEDVEPILKQEKFLAAKLKLERLPMEHKMTRADILDLEYLKSILPLLFLNKRAILFINVHGSISIRKNKKPEIFSIPENFTIKYGSRIKPGLCSFGTSEEAQYIELIETMKPYLLNYAETPDMDILNNIDNYMLSVLKQRSSDKTFFRDLDNTLLTDYNKKDDKCYERRCLYQKHCREGNIAITTAQPGDKMVNYKFEMDMKPTLMQRLIHSSLETFTEYRKPSVLQDVLLFIKYVAEPLNINRILFNKILMGNEYDFETDMKLIVSFFQNYSAIEELIIFDESCSVFYLEGKQQLVDTKTGNHEANIYRRMQKSNLKYGGQRNKSHKSLNNKTKKRKRK